MIAALSRLRSPIAALTAANLAAALLAVWPWLHQDRHPTRPASTAAPQDAPVLQPLPPLTMFAATTGRPLFSPSRRPAPAAQERGPGAIEGRYRLQGLVITGTVRHALFADTAGGRRFEIGEGESIEGWTVKRIEPNTVTLASPLGETTLTLRGTGGAQPAPQR